MTTAVSDLYSRNQRHRKPKLSFERLCQLWWYSTGHLHHAVMPKEGQRTEGCAKAYHMLPCFALIVHMSVSSDLHDFCACRQTLPRAKDRTVHSRERVEASGLCMGRGPVWWSGTPINGSVLES